MNSKTLVMASILTAASAALSDSVKVVAAGPTAMTGARADKSFAVFNEDGVFTVADSGTIEVLLVGGGGGGGALGTYSGSQRGGGGGGGGVIYRQACSITPGEYHVTVGAGGAIGMNGENSSIVELSLVAYGGGAGADAATHDKMSGDGVNGHDGGSGGGATTCGLTTTYEGGSPVDGQGFKGGSSSNVYAPGGGGGANGPGGDSDGSTPGVGGAGIECGILQAGEYYGGGGAGYRSGRTIAGGIGGGGDVLAGVQHPGEDGRGGGGAGGAAGGRGIVVIAWASVLDQSIRTSEDFAVAGSGETLLDGKDIVVCFTNNGTLTVTGTGYVEFLAVGGGGGGGSLSGNLGVSGGGAGGLVHFAALPVRAGTYDVQVGAGGEVGENGGNTSAFGIVAYGGGHGSVAGGQPGAGGSGGGASHDTKGNDSVTNSAGRAMALYGNLGCTGGASSHQYGAGGGGGAGAEGEHTGGTGNPGAGGDGLPFSIVGHEVYYAGGGAALRPGSSKSASGGRGGGGRSQSGTPYPGENGLGGGGAGNAKGGSGVLIVRYSIPEKKSTVITMR